MAARFLPTGIILDLGLPDIPGEEVLSRLREDPRTRAIPVHVISAREPSAGSPLSGAESILTKPVEVSAIRQVLQEIDHPSGSGPGRRILLVEDQPEVRRAVIRLVEDQAVTVVQATNGREALARFGEGPFACIILDLGLPDGDDGFGLLEAMSRQVRPLPPVIVYSGRDLTREEHDRLQGYTDSLIVKGLHSEGRLREEVILFLNRVSRDRPEVSGPSPEVRHRQERFSGRTVLLVDDDVRNLFSLTRSLEKRGMKVLMAGNGAEALDVLERGEKVDLILMDIMMPVMDGYDAMRALRQRESFRRLPILALTAKAMPEDQRLCLEAGANDYLAKPVELDRLFEKMRIWLKDPFG
ncbi:MAG: response regulator, partial [Magnetococcales bacterium]|nr:response regulator [Magnetococcales bacterium]